MAVQLEAATTGVSVQVRPEAAAVFCKSGGCATAAAGFSSGYELEGEFRVDLLLWSKKPQDGVLVLRLISEQVG